MLLTPLVLQCSLLATKTLLIRNGKRGGVRRRVRNKATVSEETVSERVEEREESREFSLLRRSCSCCVRRETA